MAGRSRTSSTRVSTLPGDLERPIPPHRNRILHCISGLLARHPTHPSIHPNKSCPDISRRLCNARPIGYASRPAVHDTLMSFHYAGRSDADPSRSLFSDSRPQVPGFGHKELRTKKAGRLKAREDSQSRNVQWLLPLGL